jgi:hypothetical protein
VAVALLATRQPPAPRSVTSLAPVPVAAPASAGDGTADDAAIRTGGETVTALVAGAPGASQASDVTTQANEAERAMGGRRARFRAEARYTAGNS